MPPLTATQAWLVTTALFTAGAIPITVCDARTLRIPDALTYAGGALLLCGRLLCTPRELPLHVASAALAVALFAAIRRGAGGMGRGDIKYSAVCGLYAPPVPLFAGFALAAAGALLFLLVRRHRDKDSLGRPVPFAPFMAAGTLVAMAAAQVLPLLHAGGA